MRTSTEVVRIGVAPSGAVDGVETAAGEWIAADVVVANVDAVHLYDDLLPDEGAAHAARRADPSTSGVVVLVGARGLTPGLAHHSIWFSEDSGREWDELESGRMAEDPTVYACVSAVTDPSQAPEGCENWFLLVNAPAHAEVDAVAETARILDALAGRGVDLRPRVEVVETITPADMAARYRSPGGAIYGTSSNGRRAAFLRPRNRGARLGLYLVGGSSHPGGGLPLVATSGRIVADMVAGDGWPV